MVRYALPGSRRYQERIFPDPALLDPTLGLKTYQEVIAHFTASSLEQDGIQIESGSLRVTGGEPGQGYAIAFAPLAAHAAAAAEFARTHATLLDHEHGGLALLGFDACKRTPAWNPMSGFNVNAHDGPSVWLPYLPLGMPMVNHQAVTLLHYPPLVAYRKADYLKNMTLNRWAQLLQCIGLAEPNRYHAILDVNPIAAPGSGESEYPNDYFPVNITSQFFDDETRGLSYVRSMLEVLLNPAANAANPLTLPLLVCGSPLYDPQAPAWFRTRYKEQLPQDKNKIPRADVLQAGLVRIHPDSPKPTPYMIANHMIAAGVTGTCDCDPSKIPHILKYEAQDLVAATFLNLAALASQQGKRFDPTAATQEACQRWFGNPTGNGAPQPPNEQDRLTLCALAQMDLCFDPVKIAPQYTYEQALERCRGRGGPSYSPCFGCKP